LTAKKKKIEDFDLWCINIKYCIRHF